MTFSWMRRDRRTRRRNIWITAGILAAIVVALYVGMFLRMGQMIGA